MAHEVVAFLMATHDLSDFKAILLQFLPDSSALLEALLVILALALAINQLLLGNGSTQRNGCNGSRLWYRTKSCVVVIVATMGSVMFMMFPMKSAMFMMLPMESVMFMMFPMESVMFMMFSMKSEVMTFPMKSEVMMFPMKSEVIAAVFEELPKTSLGAFMVALEVIALLMAPLCLLKLAALREDVLHGFGAKVMALTVSASSMALQGLFHLAFHVRAGRHGALHVALMIMTTGLVAFHDGNGLLTGPLESHPEGLWALLQAFLVTLALFLAHAELGDNELSSWRLKLEVWPLGSLRLLAAHLHKFHDWPIARLSAGEVRATIHIALDDSLHLLSHLGAFWQWATVMTFHVLSTLPMAFDDLKAFITPLLHLKMAMVSMVSMVFVVFVVAVVAVPQMAMAIVMPETSQPSKTQKAAEQR